ncbi:hypothetical protein ACOME3_008161 [Neoechinorhynchus agilis]
MVLSDRQKAELNSAICEYLKTNGYVNSLREFATEAGVDDQHPSTSSSAAAPNEHLSSSTRDLLEKKWMSVVRLQRKIIELETRLSQMESQRAEEEVVSDGTDGFVWRKRRNLGGQPIPLIPERLRLYGHRGPVTQVCFHPVFSFIASASEDASIKIWDYESGELEKTLKGHTDTVNDVQFRPRSGNQLASCSSDQTIRLWDLQTFETFKTLRGHDHSVHGVRYFPNDSDRLISCSRDKTIKIWDTASGFCIRTLTVDSKWARKISVTHDGAYFATCGDDLDIKIWQSNATTITDFHTRLCGHFNTIEAIEWLPPPDEDPPSVNGNGAVDFNYRTPPNQRMILSGGRDKLIMCWDALSGICLYTLNDHECWVQAIRAIRTTSDACFFISVSDDRSIIVWNASSRAIVKRIADAHEHFCFCIDIHPKGTMIATGSADSTIKLWDCRR